MSILDELYPATCTLVIDVLRQAGIDTSEWTANDDPSRRNNWSFGKDGEPQILFIWHNELYMDGDRVCYDASMQEHAIELERKNTATTRSQAKRARQFHSRVTKAYFQKLSLRVALVDGTVGDDGVAKVKTRVLDSVTWYAHRRDNETASVVLVRGVGLPVGFDPSIEFSNTPFGHAVAPPVSDSDSEPPEKQARGTATFARDSEVVRKAKLRANGLCDYCGERGFETASGGFYLEGHHVIPLGCGGPDEVWNTVAICPDDHRRAHFGKDTLAIRDELVSLLSDVYPEAQASLQEHSRKMDWRGQINDLIEEDFAS
jgi:5-methylcytosine-specific restriction protein A